MDNVFAQIKTTELKGSTFRSRILDFGDFDISEADFKIVFKKAGNILPLTNFEPQKVGNALVIPYNILESYSGEIRMEAWMTLNGVTDLALVDTMLISAENSLKSDATNQNITVTFGDVIIPVTFTQAIVNIGGGMGSGEDGKSAYEIAVDNGFVGTETEWLISLKGADGKDFTYEDFTPEQLALLKGEKGDSFEYADFTPEQLALLKGADGKSAYQIALDNGFVGTQAEWLASLQGSGGGGTAPATTFDVQNNTAAASMKATADYLFKTSNNGEEIEIPITLTATNSYLTATGGVTASANWRTSELVDVIEADNYVYYGRTDTGTVAHAVAGYNEAGVPLPSPIILGKGINAPTGYGFTIPTGVKKIRISSFNDIALKLGGFGISYKIKDSLLPPAGNSIKAIGKSWGAIGHSIWWSDGTLDGIQTLVKRIFSFNAYANYAYSGNSLSSNSITDATCILNTTKTNAWTLKDIFTYDSITNDFKLNRPIGTQDDFLNNTGVATYYGALRVLHEKLKSLNPEYIMIAGNALKRNKDNYTSWSANTVGHTLTDYSTALEWVCNRLSWRFINQFRDSGINDDNLTLFTSDSLHPTNKGYKIIADLWVAEFEKIYKRTLFA